MKYISTFLVAITICSCTYAQDNKRAVAVGGQKDDHGCLVSAGAQWSVLKNSCIQVFNEGTRLDNIDPNATTAAYVLFSENRKKAEIFMAELGSASAVLHLQSDKSYSNETYILTKSGKGYTISKKMYIPRS